ncbi:MAG: creatininase family protein, partial [Balneolaceae bacterium]|nr:creatininase family protein [Balneolaceae bacterium]
AASRPVAACVTMAAHVFVEETTLSGIRAARLAWEEGAGVMVLPTIPFGVNTGQTDIKLDMNMHPSTQAAVLDDVIEVLNRQGIHKLLVLNSHGGNNFKPILRELGVKYPDMFLSFCNWFQCFDKARYLDNPEGDHAEEMETSLIMYFTPELVRPLEEAGEGREHPFRVKALREHWAWAERQWSQATEDTGVGNPKMASAEKGERMFREITRTLAEFYVDLARADLDEMYE